jgi:hypothetical protein
MVFNALNSLVYNNPNSIRIISSFGPYATIVRHRFKIHVHLKCSFVNTDSLAVSDMLINLLLNLKHYSKSHVRTVT